MRHLLAVFVCALGCLILSACQTTPNPQAPDAPPPVSEPIPSPEPIIVTPEPTPPNPGATNPVPPIILPPVTTPPANDSFASVKGWSSADLRSALTSFQRSCLKTSELDVDQYLSDKNPQYGRGADWLAVCAAAQATPAYDSNVVRRFFENEFRPVPLTHDSATGIVTGYYQPEITVRRVKDVVYSEPILSVPSDKSVLSLPRSGISETLSSPIAFGKPIDVFFMQIQGSGVLSFENGEKTRAAYAANNGHSYTSIGRILVERGELSKDQASKQDIEDWMASAGPAKSRELMNQNKRYIFFQAEPIVPGEGPKGAQRVPLTDMASIAIDPAYYPYGLPIWLETKIPSGKGDYKGQDESLLTITQDTGKAIRGAFRADLYFGSGFIPGDKAGVMKHPGRWTVLLPIQLALRLASIS